MALLDIIKGCWSAKETGALINEQQGVYDTLTPKIITDSSVEPYFDALDFAFSKSNVKNIAITGPYGAGKSTVILSYLKSRLKKDFINVSLADFSLSGKSKKSESESVEIELSILQQILYKEDKDNLPDSRIDRIQNRNEKHILSLFATVLTVIGPILLLAVSLFPKKILSLFSVDEVTLNTIIDAYPARLIFSAVIGTVGLFFIVRAASKAGVFDKKIKLSKIAFLQGSADMASQDASSLLNNCLDEIVYFFSRSQHKIVIFEDLDRLGNTEVFVKLREINQIVNNNIRGEPVRFVYACRDDIFLGADIRTKFFDFILPVIPVMDSRNAYTHLKNKLNDFPANEQPLLKQMSLYISDMRSLQNIVNEFNLFKKVVDDNRDQAKIFSLIFYKNIYAQDYNLTDKKSGVLYSFIHDYRLRKLHENYFISLDKRLEQLNNKLVEIKKESANTDKELRKQIVSRFIAPELWPIVNFNLEQYYSNGHYVVHAENLCNDEKSFIEFFSKKSQLYVGYGNYNSSNYQPINHSSIIEEYNLRSEVIAKDKAAEYKKIVSEIHEVRESIRTRNSISLAELLKLIGWERFKAIAEGYIEKCDDRTIIDQEQLETIRDGFRFGGLEALYYLLTNGHIMQDFMMFRSVFHQGTISVNDNDYIKAVGRHMGCEEVNQNFLLDNPKDVLAELIDQRYQYRAGAIHHQIIALLLDSRHNVDTKNLSEMVAMIFQQSSMDILAIFNVLESSFVDADYFTRFVVFSLGDNRYLDKMIAVIEEQERSSIVTSIVTKMIALIPPAVSANQENYRQFIVEQGFSLISFVEDCNLQQFLNNIKLLGVIYHDISLPITPSETQALTFIAENQMYTLDKSSYRVIVSGLLQYENIPCDQVDELPWSLLEMYQLSSVKEYVNDNIDIFVREIFIDSKESSEAIVSVLTHQNLSDDLKILILKKMQFTVVDLHGFPEHIDADMDKLSYHDLFYRYDRVAPGWDALLNYICEECNLEVLTQYIEEHAQVLSKKEVSLVDGDRYELLYMKVICNDKLSDSAYFSVLKPVYINVHHWDERLSLDNFLRLIKNSKVELDADSFKQAVQCFISDTAKRNVEPFVLWFSQFKETFFSDTDYYLRDDHEDNFLEEMLVAIHNSQCFTLLEKATLLFKYRERYHESFLGGLTISNEGLLAIIALSADDDFSMNLIVRLLKNGYRSRVEIARLVGRLEQKEFSKIFNQKSATLNLSNGQQAELFLSALQQAGLIKKWSLREAGKYHVHCCYEEDENDID